MFGGRFYCVCLCTLAMRSMTIVVAAQNLAIPSTWPNATSSLDREMRAVLAADAATAMYNRINPLDKLGVVVPRVQYFSSFFSVLAVQDYYSGNLSWSSAVVSGLQVYYQERGVYGGFPDVYSDPIYWGLTFFYAYRTYKQHFLLDLAVSIYNTTYAEAFITPSIAASGSGAGRNVTFAIPSDCSVETIAGGVFVNKDVANDTSITAATVPPFMALSAYLFEQTGDPFYQETAELSLEFMLNYIWNGTIVTNGLSDVDTCNLSTVLVTENQGWFIEGLSVWANVTRNGTLLSLLETVVPSVTTFPAWTLRDGVINEDSDPSDQDAIYKGIFIRGLAEARMRFPGTDLAKYIETYIMIQFNSILSTAQSPAPNNSFYSTSWFGPPTSSFSAAGNIAALDVLNAAYSFDGPTTSGSTTATTTSHASTASHSEPSAKPKQSLSIGAVVGGVVGGAIVAFVAVASLFMLHRRRHRRDHHPREGSAVENNRPADPGHRNTAVADVEPFILPSSEDHSSKWSRFYAPREEEAPSSSVISDTQGAAQAITIRGGSDQAQGAGLNHEEVMAESAELPTLAVAMVHRLYNVLRSQVAELPPRYDG